MSDLDYVRSLEHIIKEQAKDLERVNRKLCAMHNECHILKRGIVVVKSTENDNILLDTFQQKPWWERLNKIDLAKVAAIERAERLQKLYFNAKRENRRLLEELNFRREYAIKRSKDHPSNPVYEINQLKLSVKSLQGHCAYLEEKYRNLYKQNN